jgi:spore coat protein U-like protein
VRAHHGIFASGAIWLAVAVQPAGAGTAMGTLTAAITIQASCQVDSASASGAGAHGSLNGTEVQAAFAVRCANATPYNVGLDSGSMTGAMVTTRLMTSGSETVAYKIYSDPGRGGTANGAAHMFTVLGRVVPQPTPAPATGSGIVRVTVAY